MKPSDLRFAFGCLLAVVVPAAALHFSAPDERLRAGLTAAPFGWPRVLVAHLVTTLPLGLLAARLLRTVPAVNDLVRGAWLVVGAAGTAVAVQVCHGVGEAVSTGEFGFAPLLVLRAALAFGLVLPWCVFALGSSIPGAATNPAGAFGLGTAFALIPVGLYCEAVSAARTEQAVDLVRRERAARADVVLAGLVELGSDQLVEKKSPEAIRKQYAKLLPRLAGLAERPLPANARPRDRWERALVLVQLDRTAEAAEVLEPLATPEDDTASLMLAAFYRDLERWAASDALYTRVLEHRLPRATTDSGAADECVTAIEGLAFNARADRRPLDAERALKRGLEAVPGRGAQLHLQLGRHYHAGGRPGPAVEHLREAARLDPALSLEADKTIRQIRTATPGCFSRY